MYQALNRNHFTPLWTNEAGILPARPRPKAIPWLWKWSEISRLARRSRELLRLDRCGDRWALGFADSRLKCWVRLLSVAGVISLLLPGVAQAEGTLGGHFGFVLPLVTRAGGATTTLSDRFSIGFPTGITVKTSKKVAFDLA